MFYLFEFKYIVFIFHFPFCLGILILHTSFSQSTEIIGFKNIYNQYREGLHILKDDTSGRESNIRKSISFLSLNSFQENKNHLHKTRKCNYNKRNIIEIRYIKIIDSLPFNVNDIINTTYLIFTIDDLKEIPTELKILKNLRTLIINNSKLEKYPMEFNHPFLEELNLSKNMIHNDFKDNSQYLENDIILSNSLPNLKILNLSHNKMNFSFNFISDSLQYLDLSYNSFTVIKYKTFKKLKNLIYLNLSNNCISEILATSLKINNAVYLNFSNNCIKFFSLATEKYEFLNELDLSDNPIQRLFLLPDLLPSLKKLKLSNTNCLNFYDSFLKLPSLKKLDISNNGITKMDMTRFPLPMLKYLDLSKNCIIELDISNLKKLKILNLSYNRLEKIPNNFTMLENLKELFLDFNLFITLPEILFKLKSLSFLSLSCNEIKDLTNIIENDTLEIISLNFNRFSVIDSTILKLKKLRKLYIISSYIIIVPEELRKMGISVITKI